MDKKRVTELSIIANNVRKNALTAVYNAASGHPGGSLSIADVLTLLYFEVMNVDPKNPKMENRDRFVLSKGHTAPALYGVLAERGFIPKEDVATLRHVDSYVNDDNLTATTKLLLSIKDASHLKMIIANLKKVRSVNEVIRDIK